MLNIPAHLGPEEKIRFIESRIEATRGMRIGNIEGKYHIKKEYTNTLADLYVKIGVAENLDAARRKILGFCQMWGSTIKHPWSTNDPIATPETLGWTSDLLGLSVTEIEKIAMQVPERKPSSKPIKPLPATVQAAIRACVKAERDCARHMDAPEKLSAAEARALTTWEALLFVCDKHKASPDKAGEIVIAKLLESLSRDSL